MTDDVQGSYAAASAAAPDIFYTPRNGGHWMMRRIEAIADIVKDPEHFSAREMQIPRVPDPPLMVPLNFDPPTNIPYRQVLMPRFSPKAIRELEPRVRQWAVSIFEEVSASGRCDFIADVSSRFPVSVFMELMGLPLERLRELREIADAFFDAHSPDQIAEMSARILGLLGELVALRRAEPRDDLVTHLTTVDFEGRKLADDAILAMCLVLFLGGMDTVTNVSGFAFQHLAGDPELQARLAADPALAPKFVDEAIPMFSVINTPRLVVKDIDLRGVPFRTGDMVLNLLSVAGRDDQGQPRRRPLRPRPRAAAAPDLLHRPAPLPRPHPGPHRDPCPGRGMAGPRAPLRTPGCRGSWLPHRHGDGDQGAALDVALPEFRALGSALLPTV